MQRTWTTPDYEQADRTQTVRIHVSPVADVRRATSVMRPWQAIALRYINHHRDFIATAGGACEDDEADIEGLLTLELKVRDVPGGAWVSADGALTRCGDGAKVRTGYAEGEWESEDPHLTATIASYVEEHGEPVRPYVAPGFHLLRALLDTLPRPRMTTDEQVMEKISLEE